MWDLLKDPDTWLSIISIGIAVLALFQSHKQIQLSNKQQLFDRRLNNWLIISGLLELYKENQVYFIQKRRDEPIFSAETEFQFLCNNSYLQEVVVAVHERNSNNQNLLLTKLEDMKNIGLETSLIFPKDIADVLCDYVLAYKDLLMELYRYHILLEHIRESRENIDFKNYTLDKTLAYFKEPEQRKELLDKFSKCTQAYTKIVETEIEQKIIRAIHL